MEDSMRQTLTRVVTLVSLTGAALAMTQAGPAAQQAQPAPPQEQPAAPQRQLVATPEAMERAQENYRAQQLRDAISHNKAGVVEMLMERWRQDIGETEKGRVGFQTAFMNASSEKLLEVAQARTWDGVVNAVLGLGPEATLGSFTNDLTFTPLTPCRVMDSRFGTGAYAGPFTSGQTVSLYVTDPLNANGHNQGGATNCGIPFSAGTAVALNITVVPIAGSGDLKIFPFAGTSPNASIINFYAGLNLANAASAAIALANSTNDLSITVEFATQVHIIVDVMGYYAASQATPLQVVRVNTAPTTAANGGVYTLDSPACPAGYTLIGGGYNETAQISGLWVWQNAPGDGGTSTAPTFWRFRGYNQTGGTTSLTVYGVCGRVPGR